MFSLIFTLFHIFPAKIFFNCLQQTLQHIAAIKLLLNESFVFYYYFIHIIVIYFNYFSSSGGFGTPSAYLKFFAAFPHHSS